MNASTGLHVPALFLPDPGDRRFYSDVVVADCDWVLAGDGTARRKWTGWCLLFDPELAPDLFAHGAGDLGGWFLRSPVKWGEDAPVGWVEGHGVAPIAAGAVGWLAAMYGSVRIPLAAALARVRQPEPGTYELCGPGIRRNPDHLELPTLIRHDRTTPVDIPRTYTGMARWLHAHPYPGVVFHRDDGSTAAVRVDRTGFRHPGST